MNHDEIKDKLVFFHDPELAEGERGEISVHVSSCPECAKTLKQWENARVPFAGLTPGAPSEFFVNRVMTKLAEREELKKPVEFRWPFPQWIFPTLGYGFAFFLMFVAISQRELPANTGEVLLADVPQASRWTFSAEQPDINQLVEVP